MHQCLNISLLCLTDERNQQCDLCDRAFRNVYSLRKHKKTIHLKEYPLNCDKCGRGFHRKSALKSHKCEPRSESDIKIMHPPEVVEAAPTTGGAAPTTGGDPGGGFHCAKEVDTSEVGVIVLDDSNLIDIGTNEVASSQIVGVLDVVAGDDEAVTMVIEPVTYGKNMTISFKNISPISFNVRR